MTHRISRRCSALAIAATLALAASPVMARGWGGGWGGGRHHHRGPDAGDIFAGILVIGGIAAIASAASKSNRERREQQTRYPERDSRDSRDDNTRYGNERDSGYRSSGRGLDGAVDACVYEVERGSTRVDSVDSVDRDGDGWRVEGRINGGRPFACAVTSSGRIRSMTVDGRAALRDEGDSPATAAAPVDDDAG